MTDVDESTAATRTWARPGALVGCVIGLWAAWRMLAPSIDPSVTDHSPLFPSAVMILSVICCFVVAACTAIGLGIGWLIRR